MNLHSTMDNLYYEESSLGLSAAIVEPSFSFSSTYSELIDSLDNIIGKSTLRESFFGLPKDSSDFKNLYIIDNEEKITGFVIRYRLSDFLLWIDSPLFEIFGDIKKTLHLTQCWDDTDYHLVLTIFSEKEDMEELTQLDNRLFSLVEKHAEIDHILQYVVIAQR